MKHALLLALITVFFAPIVALSQSTYVGVAKLDVGLKQLLADRKISTLKISDVATPQGAPEMIPIIFKCDPTEAEAIVVRYGGELHTRAGNIFTGLIPLTSVLDFASAPAVMRIESSQRVEANTLKARKQIGADKVMEGGLPSGVKYTGKGVLIGIIDSGIDFTHPDFRMKTDSTKTRIFSVWDQLLSGNTKPPTFNYGSEWTNAQLNAALGNPTLVPHIDSVGHGTYVAGGAAGLRGIAPDAELVIVYADIHWQSDTTVQQDTKSVLDGVAYVYEKAVQRDMPAVVNISLGYVVGTPHDGTSLVEQGLANFVASRKGFHICVSAGNNNGQQRHFGGYMLTADSTWTYARAITSSRLHSMFEAAYDDSTFIAVEVDSAGYSMNEDSIVGLQNIFRTPWISIADLKNSPTPLQYLAKFNVGDSAVVIDITGSAFNDKATEVQITTRRQPEPDYSEPWYQVVTPVKILFKGKGKVHGWWSTEGVDNYSRTLAYTIPQNSAFRASDDAYMMNVFACAENVFSVGSYMGNQSYTDVTGKLQYGANYLIDWEGSVARFSNHGPTTDGRIKPDIMAPGVNVSSSMSRSTKYPASSKVDANTICSSGTSISSPIVAGAIALLLQQSPLADYQQVLQAITENAIADNFTDLSGALPNPIWGHGKLDIFAAMGGNVPSGVFDDENNADGGTGANAVHVFPNPATSVVQFSIGGNLSGQTLTVYNVRGSVVAHIALVSNAQSLNVETWKKGAYYYRVGTSGAAGWFVVQN